MFSWVKECPSCKEVLLSAERTHCVKCGDELEYKFDKGWLCDQCGEEVEEDWVFCGYCGVDLEWFDVKVAP